LDRTRIERCKKRARHDTATTRHYRSGCATWLGLMAAAMIAAAIAVVIVLALCWRGAV
jgi:hypothetical protein